MSPFSLLFDTNFISLDPNTYYIPKTKTVNNVSEFIHSNLITMFYYSICKHKSLLHKYLMCFSEFCTL